LPLRGAGYFLGDKVLLGSGACATACFAHDLSSTEAFGALRLHDPGAIADVAFHDTLVCRQFTGTFAFVTL